MTDQPAWPPTWFNLDHYRSSGKLTIHGWLYQLAIRRHFTNDPSDPYGIVSQIEEFGVVPMQENAADFLFGGDLEAAEHPLNHDAVRSISCLSAFNLREALSKDLKALCHEEHERPFPKSEEHLEPFDLHVNLRGKAIVEIDLDCPDSYLKQAFATWLKSARKSLGSPKRYAFREDRGKQWADANVLPYIDLTQAAKRGSINYSAADLASLLFPDDPDITRIRNTRGLAERLLSTPYLVQLKLQAAKTAR